MDMATGRPNHIEDALVTMHDNQWFTWTDSITVFTYLSFALRKFKAYRKSRS